MNGALPPKRYELSWNWRITLDMRSPPVEGLHIALRRALIELPRPADLVFGIGDHFLPLRDPADGAREREDAGEHRHRDAERALHDAGVEIHIGVELAADEVVVLQRDALQLERQLEQAIVVQAELLQHLVAGLAHQLCARVEVLVDAVAEAHQAHAGMLVLHLLDELRNLRDVADLFEHLQARLIGTAVRRAPQAGDARSDAGVWVCSG